MTSDSNNVEQSLIRRNNGLNWGSFKAWLQYCCNFSWQSSVWEFRYWYRQFFGTNKKYDEFEIVIPWFTTWLIYNKLWQLQWRTSRVVLLWPKKWKTDINHKRRPCKRSWRVRKRSCVEKREYFGCVFGKLKSALSLWFEE